MTRTVTQPHRTRTKTDDGDVRYDPTITGYTQPRRARLRAAEHQVASLVTDIARDNGSAGMELTDPRLAEAIRQAIRAISDWRTGRRLPDDARPDLIHLAAVATLWAEAIDVPPDLPGMRIRRPQEKPQKAPGAVPVRARRRRKANPEQLALTI